MYVVSDARRGVSFCRPLAVTCVALICRFVQLLWCVFVSVNKQIETLGEGLTPWTSRLHAVGCVDVLFGICVGDGFVVCCGREN